MVHATRLGTLALSTLTLLLVAQAPAASSQSAETTAEYYCPPDVMTYFAIPLSTQIRGLPNLTQSANNSQTASVINEYIPDLQTALNFTIPALKSTDNNLQALQGPFQTFITDSQEVNPAVPDSACNFLIATVELAAFVALIATSNASGLALLSLFNEAGHDCGSSCQMEIENSVDAFAVKYVGGAASGVKSAICSSQDPISSLCNPSPWPEFPYQLTALAALTAIVVVSYLLLRKPHDANP